MVIFNSYVKLPEGIGAKDIESTETWPVLTRIYHCEVQRPSDLTDLRNLKQGGILTARIGCSKAKASQKQGRSQEHDAPHDMNDTVPVLCLAKVAGLRDSSPMAQCIQRFGRLAGDRQWNRIQKALKTSRDLDRFTVDTTCTLKNEEKLMEYHS